MSLWPYLSRRMTPERTERYLETLPSVLRYRQAYHEVFGRPSFGLPAARRYPDDQAGVSYTEKLVRHLDIEHGRGAEIGPLNIPQVDKSHNVLYVDHLDTKGLRTKYPTIEGIAEVDRPLLNSSLAHALASDTPLDYIIASQMLEHAPNPIGWLKDCAEVLKSGGLLSIALPDRKHTFDFMREESRTSDLVAAHFRAIMHLT